METLDGVALTQLMRFDRTLHTERERFIRKLERETVRRRECIDLLAQQRVWRRSPWVCEVLISDMTPRQAADAVVYLESNATPYAWCAGRSELHGDQAVTWMRGTPLFQALRARSLDRPTLREWLKERR